jgi:hypothetical protein
VKAKYLTFFGTALTLVLAGQAAIAQSPTPTTEIELSPEGFKILCERFPLNSRCGGTNAPASAPVAPSAGESTTTESDDTMTRPAGPPSSPGTPDSVTVPEDDAVTPTEDDAVTPSSDMQTSPDSSDSMTPADDSMAPADPASSEEQMTPEMAPDQMAPDQMAPDQMAPETQMSP